MAVVLTSTTEPQQNLDHAASDKWEDPSAIKEFKSKAEPAPEPEPEQEPVEVPEEPNAEPAEPAEEPEPETETEAAEQPKGHKGGGKDKRIARLTAINAQQARELEEIRARLAAQENKQQVSQPQVPQAPQEPRWADYQAAGKSIDEFLRDRDAFKEATEKFIAKEENRKEVDQEFGRKVSQALSNYDDWSEVVSASKVRFTETEVLDAIKETDNGPDVAYYLAKHEDEAAAINGMSKARAIIAIGKLSDQLASEKENPAPKAKSKVKPPEPITPVTSSGTKAIKNWWEMSPAESVKFLNKRDNDKRMGKI